MQSLASAMRKAFCLSRAESCAVAILKLFLSFAMHVWAEHMPNYIVYFFSAVKT